MTAPAEPPDRADVSPPRDRAARVVVLVVLVALVVTAVVLIFTTDRGRQVVRDPQSAGAEFRAWVRANPVVAPLIFVAAYVALALLMAPLWWMQVLAGYGFGLLGGVLWCQVGATIAAPSATALSRWVAGEWFHRRVGSRMPRLRAVEEKLGHNGLLVVMAARILYGMPFGPINYAIGLTRIPVIDVLVGTLLGGIPKVTLYVTIGAGPALLTEWRFLLILGVIHLVVLSPLVLRYARPDWFRRVGIE